MLRSPFVSPIALELGPLSIRWYGILIALGLVIGMHVAAKEAKRRSLETKHVSDMVLWIGVAGIIGARLYFVLFNIASYDSVVEMISVWKGGLAIHGALIGGLLGFIAYVKKYKLRNVWSYLDCLILGVLIGQVIGRFGNFVNQEAFGRPTNLPWGLYIDPANRPPLFEHFESFHPTFLYESLWNIAVFFILWHLNTTKKLHPGQTVALYCIAYSFGRFWIEGLRLDSLMIGPFRTAQVVSILLIIAGVVLFRRRSSSKPA